MQWSTKRKNIPTIFAKTFALYYFKNNTRDVIIKSCDSFGISCNSPNSSVISSSSKMEV